MRRAITGRIASAAIVVVVALGLSAGEADAAGAGLVPAQVNVTAPSTTEPAVATVAPEPASSGQAAVTTRTVGDPAAERRVRRIVATLSAVAAAVLLTTVLFWRATRPIPRPLKRLQGLGSRAGRRQAAAGSAARAPAPPRAEAEVPADADLSPEVEVPADAAAPPDVEVPPGVGVSPGSGADGDLAAVSDPAPGDQLEADAELDGAVAGVVSAATLPPAAGTSLRPDG